MMLGEKVYSDQGTGVETRDYVIKLITQIHQVTMQHRPLLPSRQVLSAFRCLS